MSVVEFKIKKKTKVYKAGGATQTKIEYVPVGIHEKEIKITTTSSEVADSVGLAIGNPDDAFFIDFDVKKNNPQDAAEALEEIFQKKQENKK